MMTPRSPSSRASCAIMSAAARRIMLKVPIRLTLMMRLKSSSGIAWPSLPTRRLAPPMPAQLTRMRAGPWAARAAASAASTLAVSVMSQAAAWAPTRLTSRMLTRAPSWASWRTTSAPSPEAPPVTSAACPCNCMVVSLLVGSGWIFQQQRDALATADTGRGDAVAGAALAHFARGGDRESYTGRRQRMAQCNGAAVDVEPAAIESEFAFHGDGLRSLGFIDFEAADVVQRQAVAFQQQATRRRRTDAHDLGRHADHGGGDYARQRLAWMVAQVAAGGDDGGRGRIHQRGAVAAGLHTVGVERTQLAQHFHRRRPWMRIVCGLADLALQFDMTIVVAVQREGLVDHRHDLVDMEAFLLCAQGALEGQRRIFVDFAPCDAVFLRQVFCGLRHGDAGRGIGQRLPHVILEFHRCAQAKAAAMRERSNRIARHRFRTDHQRRVGIAAFDLVAGLADQLEAGTADALHHDGRDIDRNACVQTDMARQHVLEAIARRHVAGDDGADVGSRYAAAPEDFTRDLDAHVGGRQLREAAAIVHHRCAHAG